MKTSKNLFRDGTNPHYYEAFGTDVDTLRGVLNKHNVEFEEVEHTGITGGKSIRFYVDAPNDDVTKELENL